MSGACTCAVYSVTEMLAFMDSMCEFRPLHPTKADSDLILFSISYKNCYMH